MCVHHDIARMAANSERHANDVGDAGVVHGQPDVLGCSPPKGPPGCLDVSYVTSRIVAITQAMLTGLGLVCGLGLRRGWPGPPDLAMCMAMWQSGSRIEATRAGKETMQMCRFTR